MRPILSPNVSVNHRLPSGPAVMKPGWLSAVGTGNSLIVPFAVIRATLLAPPSVNHKLPSRPAVMPSGPLGVANSFIVTPEASAGETFTTTIATTTTMADRRDRAERTISILQRGDATCALERGPPVLGRPVGLPCTRPGV